VRKIIHEAAVLFAYQLAESVMPVFLDLDLTEDADNGFNLELTNGRMEITRIKTDALV
jgi:hypothetical protein